MKKVSFEINSEYRMLENSELVSSSLLIGNDCVCENCEEYNSGKDIRFVFLARMTPAKQKKIAMAAIELFKRNLSGDEQKKSIRCSEDIFNLMQSIVGDIENEEVWVLLLNSKLKMIKRIRVASGGIDRAIVDVRIILKEAIMNNAVALALIHNHPSGNERPSSDDDMITKQLVDAAKFLNVKMIDHLIIGKDKYYSYSDEGRL
jgi:DNA repair protein RadC